MTFPFNVASSTSTRTVTIEINFDKNKVYCLQEGKPKGFIFNGPKDLKKESFGLFVETKRKGSKIGIMNDQIKYFEKEHEDLHITRMLTSTKQQLRKVSDGQRSCELTD